MSIETIVVIVLIVLIVLATSGGAAAHSAWLRESVTPSPGRLIRELDPWPFRVTGIFDHPAASSCTRTEMDGAPVSSQGCRLNFAITRLVPGP